MRRKRAWCASSRERACVGALACAHTRTPAARWRPRLARQSTAVHRGRGPVSLAQWAFVGHKRLQPARCGARTPQARVLRLLRRQNAVARSRESTHERRLIVGGRDCHVRARPCTEGESHVARATRAFIGHGPTPTSGTWHEHAASALAASPLSLERERERWRVSLCAHAKAGCSLGAAAGTSEHRRALRKSAVSLAQWAFVGHKRLQPSQRGARTPQAGALRLRPRESTR